MLRLIILFYFLIQTIIISQNSVPIIIKENIITINNQKYTLEEGDLIFQDLDSSPLCYAIEKVTTSANNKSFSHVGICVIENSELFVLEAFSNGVELIKIDEFITRSLNDDGYPKISVGRLIPNYEDMIKPAITKAKEFIGKDYDELFLLNNDKYYCSELIYEIFSQSNYSLFKLQPMTFKEPETKEYMEAWVNYFEEMAHEIPEGMLGTNPGYISRSENINIIYDFEKK